MATKTTEQFIAEAVNLHGSKYDYTLVKYKSVRAKVKIICLSHGPFNMRAGDHIHSKQGCPACAKHEKRLTTDRFIQHAESVHGKMYDYSLVRYQWNKVPVDIICRIHGVFQQTPNNHVSGTRCPRCAVNTLHSVETFINKARKVHGLKYDYSHVVYTGVSKKVEIICLTHGKFDQTPTAHVDQKQGCPRCRIPNHSKEAGVWILNESQKINYPIQTTLNGGEYMLPNTRYRVDGFCHGTNTVYEFWGDFWHGNPDVYNATDINKVTCTTFGELHKDTMKKRQYILDAGYNLIEIWENDWNKLKGK